MRKHPVLALLLGIIWLAPAAAQQAAQAQERRERAEGLQHLLDGATPNQVAKGRRLCAAGSAQRTTDKSRALGSWGLADAADECPVLLLRQGRDGTLLTLYRELLVELTGQPVGHEQLPPAIGNAVMRGATQVPIGGSRAAAITAALAFDAGFTVAHAKGERHAAGMPDVRALRPVAERCLAQAERDLAVCYSTGYVYGARAVSGLPLSAP